MKLRSEKEIEIANLLDSGYSYSDIEVKLNVYPSLISRVRKRMIMIRATNTVALRKWSLDEEVEMRIAEKEALLLSFKLKV